MFNLLSVAACKPRRDRDLPRLHGLGDLSRQIDPQQPLLERGALHLHILGQIECPPEWTGGDALVQVLGLALLRLAALHGKHILLCRDGDLLRREARKRERDPVLIFTGALNVVRRVIFLACQPRQVIDEIVKKFEWQPHTVRGAIAGALKKKLGLTIVSEQSESRGRVYRISD